MVVKLRKVGNSSTLTVPKDIKTRGVVYDVRNEGDNIIFSPVQEHHNIFGTKEWREYDYQKAIRDDVELQEVKPVGREVID